VMQLRKNVVDLPPVLLVLEWSPNGSHGTSLRSETGTATSMRRTSTGSNFSSNGRENSAESGLTEGRSTSAPSATMQQYSGYLFNPLPNQSPPILAPIHTSNSLETQIHNYLMQHPLFDFDGMTIDASTNWLDDPFYKVSYCWESLTM
jgi:hypothetical protein